MAGDIKEAVCRTSDSAFDPAENANIPTVTYEVWAAPVPIPPAAQYTTELSSQWSSCQAHGAAESDLFCGLSAPTAIEAGAAPPVALLFLQVASHTWHVVFVCSSSPCAPK